MTLKNFSDILKHLQAPQNFNAKSFFIASQFWTPYAGIFECDRNFHFDLGLEISTTDPQMTLKTFLGYFKG